MNSKQTRQKRVCYPIEAIEGLAFCALCFWLAFISSWRIGALGAEAICLTAIFSFVAAAACGFTIIMITGFGRVKQLLRVRS